MQVGGRESAGAASSGMSIAKELLEDSSTINGPTANGINAPPIRVSSAIFINMAISYHGCDGCEVGDEYEGHNGYDGYCDSYDGYCDSYDGYYVGSCYDGYNY